MAAPENEPTLEQILHWIRLMANGQASPAAISGNVGISSITGTIPVRDGNLTPLGYTQLTSLVDITAIQSLVPSGTVAVLIGTKTKGVRFTDTSATTPTTASGYPLAADSNFWYTGNPLALRFREQEASAEVNLLYYGLPSTP